MFHHRRQYKMQRESYNELIATLEEGHVLVVADFQERYTWDVQDEVQSPYWQQQSTTLFPCPIFFNLNGVVWTYSFVVLSDDSSQDSAWVQHTFQRLLKEEIPPLLRRCGASPMTRVTFFTDNCSKQFKCRFSFGWIADAGVFVDGAPHERVHVEAHYYGACHGKSLSDSEGGVVKTFAKSRVTTGQLVIESSRDLFEKLRASLEFNLFQPTDVERQASSVAVGTGQMLMIKEVREYT